MESTANPFIEILHQAMMQRQELNAKTIAWVEDQMKQSTGAQDFTARLRGLSQVVPMEHNNFTLQFCLCKFEWFQEPAPQGDDGTKTLIDDNDPRKGFLGWLGL